MEIVERDDGFIDASKLGTARGGSASTSGRGGTTWSASTSRREPWRYRRRGVGDARALSIDELDPGLGMFDTIVLLPAELAEVVEGTGWRIARVLDSEDTYVAILDPPLTRPPEPRPLTPWPVPGTGHGPCGLAPARESSI